jgi:hypothetical protein
MGRRFIVIHLYEIFIWGPGAWEKGVLVTAEILCPGQRLVKAQSVRAVIYLRECVNVS